MQIPDYITFRSGQLDIWIDCFTSGSSGLGLIKCLNELGQTNFLHCLDFFALKEE